MSLILLPTQSCFILKHLLCATHRLRLVRPNVWTLKMLKREVSSFRSEDGEYDFRFFTSVLFKNKVDSASSTMNRPFVARSSDFVPTQYALFRLMLLTLLEVNRKPNRTPLTVH
jgi:hypothetical protein